MNFLKSSFEDPRKPTLYSRTPSSFRWRVILECLFSETVEASTSQCYPFSPHVVGRERMLEKFDYLHFHSTVSSAFQRTRQADQAATMPNKSVKLYGTYLPSLRIPKRFRFSFKNLGVSRKTTLVYLTSGSTLMRKRHLLTSICFQ